jgi:hypothetical protein
VVVQRVVNTIWIASLIGIQTGDSSSADTLSTRTTRLSMFCERWSIARACRVACGVLHSRRHAVSQSAGLERRAVRHRRHVRGQEGQPRGAVRAADSSLGFELRLTAANELLQSHVCRSQDDVLSTFEQWQAAMLEKAGVDRMDRRRPCGSEEEFRPALTAAEHAELEAEARVLIARIRRPIERRRAGDFDDPGNIGVCHADFLAGWNGVLLKPPSLSSCFPLTQSSSDDRGTFSGAWPGISVSWTSRATKDRRGLTIIA